jgi:transcriptional regulatory protein LevR
MRLAINHYLQELHAISERRYETEPGWVRFINHDLLDALRESEFYFKDAFPFQYGTKQLIALGLHLESYRKQAGEKRRSALPGVPPASALYRKSAEKLADFLEKRIHLHLPEREKELLAHLLASTTSDTVETKNRVIVYLVTHGKSTASSMAEVTNYLLGNPVIHPVDMPLTEATVVTYKKVREHFAGLDRHTSILMLVDIGSLVTMGETLSKDTGLSIKSLANVNLPMLIEAGRKALIPGNSLDTVYEAAKSAYFALVPKRQLPESRHIDKQRLIVTICLTGEGTAQLLHDWLVDQIEPEDDDVAVRAIRIDPVSKDTSMLSSLQEQYRMIAIIGTFPVDFGAVPFIPALELLKDDGNARLGRLLELSRNHRSARTFDKVKKQLPQDRDEMWELAMTGLGKIVHYLNPHTFYQVTSGHFERLTTFYRWDQESELGMWMHLGSVAEKIFRNKMTGKEEPVFPDEDVNLPVTAEDHAMWDPLFHQLGKELQLRLSEPLRLSLIKLGKRQITA